MLEPLILPLTENRFSEVLSRLRGYGMYMYSVYKDVIRWSNDRVYA
jgi:hypothetical protein